MLLPFRAGSAAPERFILFMIIQNKVYHISPGFATNCSDFILQTLKFFRQKVAFPPVSAFVKMFCPLPGQRGIFPLFCQGKKFSTKIVYTFRKQPVIFPQVENPVESVQKSSRSARFPGGIKQFPPGFQQQVPPYPGKSLTICKIQVGIMTIFRIRNCPLLQFPPTSF